MKCEACLLLATTNNKDICNIIFSFFLSRFISSAEYHANQLLVLQLYYTSRIPLFDLGNNGLYDENLTANFFLRKHVLNNFVFRKTGESSPNCNKAFNIVKSLQQ